MSSYILLTGAAGFIGWATAQHLLKSGYSVAGVDNLNDYYSPSLKKKRIESLIAKFPRTFKFQQLDIEDFDSLKTFVAGNKVDSVINLAARAGVRASLVNPSLYYSSNVMGSLNLLKVMLELGIGRIISASTSSVYAGLPMPFTEDQNCFQPRSPYAASKQAMETLGFSFHHNFGVDVIIPRFFTVYGPYGRPDMSYFKFISSIQRGLPITLFGDGEQRRDFTYVDDIANAIERCLTLKGYHILNLGNDKPFTVNQMISIIERSLGKRALIDSRPINNADMPATWANIERAREYLGWQPKVGFEDGLQMTIMWFQENPWAYDIPLVES